MRGKLVEGTELRHKSRDLGVDFVTPKIDLDALIALRTEPGPLFDVKLNEILDFLAETGERMKLDKSGYLREAVDRISVDERAAEVGDRAERPHGCGLSEQGQAPGVRRAEPRRCEVARRVGAARGQHGPPELHARLSAAPDSRPARQFAGRVGPVDRLWCDGQGGEPVQDGIERPLHGGRHPAHHARGRSQPPGPALHVGDLLAWWRRAVERAIFRPQYFDKIVAWGGGDAINNVIKYLMPGLQLVSFDPKTSISMIGIEAFDSDEILDEVATRAANDVGMLNQEACVCSRVLFVEGDRKQVDRFCERLQQKLVDRNSHLRQGAAAAA